MHRQNDKYWTPKESEKVALKYDHGSWIKHLESWTKHRLRLTKRSTSKQTLLHYASQQDELKCWDVLLYFLVLDSEYYFSYSKRSKSINIVSSNK